MDKPDKSLHFVDGEAARKKMNRLAAENKDFVFAVDYRGENCIVESVDCLDSSLLQFSFRGTGNALPFGKNTCGVQPVWNVAAPDFGTYRRSFDTVKSEIIKGNSYLVNLTAELGIDTDLSLLEIFRCADASYKLWVKDRFVCFSPETFIRISPSGTISSFPMKGTVDAALPDAAGMLIADEKESAEHATIVDLIRNDLSIVATGVHVARYRYVDLLQTNRGRILQTSSEVSGQLAAGFRDRIGDIVFSQLPAGSITGAPKPKTVEIIRNAETYERGFYTGVMGRWSNGELDSAVMIRFVENRNGRFFFKAGGGVTSRSDCRKEYLEIIQKAYVPIC